MNFAEYTDLINTRLQRNFDTERDITILDQQMQLYAKSEIHNESYFASKKVKVWRAEIYEYCFVKCYESLDDKNVEDFQQFLVSAVDYLVKPHTEHMSSIITGIMVVDDIPQDLEKKISGFKHRKTYAFSFKGWADVRLLAVSLHSNRVISNRKGKEVENFYLPFKIEDKKSI
ncbi:MAG: hypothetical protein APF84_02320 [Gracilibacter sp. BRH_c7a]|nr:MAG: hypothetical protein APF84_02320 [Gracilibacter sp. BRH_c7a]